MSIPDIDPTAIRAAMARIAELEAERDTYSRVIDTLSADNRRLAAERDKWQEASAYWEREYIRARPAP